MKKYIKIDNDLLYTNEDGSGGVIPIGHPDYNLVLKEVEEKKAEIVPYKPPTPTWEQIRSIRNNLLQESDWIGLPDAQPKPNKEVWLTYRQALRDITKTYSSPETVVWPKKPL